MGLKAGEEATAIVKASRVIVGVDHKGDGGMRRGVSGSSVPCRGHHSTALPRYPSLTFDLADI